MARGGEEKRSRRRRSGSLQLDSNWVIYNFFCKFVSDKFGMSRLFSFLWTRDPTALVFQCLSFCWSLLPGERLCWCRYINIDCGHHLTHHHQEMEIVSGSHIYHLLEELLFFLLFLLLLWDICKNVWELTWILFQSNQVDETNY